VKEARNLTLLQLLEENSRRRNQTLVGAIQEVLVEGQDKKGLRFMGRTSGNRIVHFDCGPDRIGRLAAVRIDHTTTTALYGALI
jgi:tRNA-2-methylthio-N6-dimethylallyladenosine synthase